MRAMIRSPECASDLVLDEWLAGELGDEDARRLEHHVSGCERCSAARASLERDRDEFLARAPDFRAHAELAARAARPVVRTRVLRPATWAALAAAAASVLIWVARPFEQPSAATRSKGGAHIDYFVKRGERVMRAGPDQHVRTGDLLRFTYTTSTARFFALLDVDSHGARVYYPAAGSAVSLTPGNDVALDFSVELDDASGDERVLGVFCEQSFAVEPLRVALARSQTPALPGCQLDMITLRREPR